MLLKQSCLRKWQEEACYTASEGPARLGAAFQAEGLAPQKPAPWSKAASWGQHGVPPWLGEVSGLERCEDRSGGTGGGCRAAEAEGLTPYRLRRGRWAGDGTGPCKHHRALGWTWVSQEEDGAQRKAQIAVSRSPAAREHQTRNGWGRGGMHTRLWLGQEKLLSCH